MKIFLIRHGESTSDIENRYGGWYNDHLTERGKEQARARAKTLIGKGIEVVFSSPFFRARETAQTIAGAIRARVEIVEDIKERNHYGILTGMNMDEAREKYPELVKRVSNVENTITGAEDFAAFNERIKQAFQTIANSHNATVALVTHKGPIRSIIEEFFKIGRVEKMGDAGLLVIDINGKKAMLLETDNATIVERD